MSTPGREKWLAECVASVAPELPLGAEHLIIRHKGDWVQQQWDAVQGANLVAFVDDDDLLEPGALAACLDAHSQQRVGLVFTDELEVDSENTPIRMGVTGRRTYLDLSMHPRAAHHLSVFRPNLVPLEVLHLCLKWNLGADWLMRASAGLLGGAVHVPRVGYRWRRHAGQVSITDHLRRYTEAIPELRQFTRSLLKHDKAIPEYQEAVCS